MTSNQTHDTMDMFKIVIRSDNLYLDSYSVTRNVQFDHTQTRTKGANIWLHCLLLPLPQGRAATLPNVARSVTFQLHKVPTLNSENALTWPQCPYSPTFSGMCFSASGMTILSLSFSVPTLERVRKIVNTRALNIALEKWARNGLLCGNKYGT